VRPALILVALVVACQSPPAPIVTATPTPPGVRGGTLVMGDFEYPDSLDPLHATTENDLRVAGLLFEPLWTLDPDLKPVPRLLAAMPVPRVGKDGSMSLDLRLRPGLRWSDGAPLTADDVVFAVDAIRSDAYPGRARSGFDRIASQERRSETELIWRFSGVDPAWPLLGPLAIPLPEHRLAALAPTAWSADPYFQRPDVVSGPFTISGAVPGRLLQLAANPRYLAGRPRGPWLDAITFRAYTGKAALIDGLQTGETDLGFHLLPADLPQLAQVAHSRSEVAPTLRGEFLLVNHAAGPWAGDATLLHVLAESVDRTALDQAALDGSASMAAGLFPPSLKEYDAALPPPLTVPEAKSALDADGWTVGPDGARAKAGRRLAFSLLSICDDQVRQAEQGELVRQLGLLGAVVSADCEPRAGIFSRLAGGGFEMALISNTWQLDPSAWAPFATSAGGLDWGHCADPALDQAFAAGGATLDAKARQTAYRAAAQEWLRVACTVPLYEWPAVTQRTTRLHGFQPNPVAGLDSWNAADWWLGS
jgi:peptide/nickel transport system substrate-binding protein